MKLTYTNFKSNPLMYVLFLPIVATVSLFYMLYNTGNKRVEDANEVNKKQGIIIEKKDAIIEKKDTIINNLYEINGARKILEKIKSK